MPGTGSTPTYGADQAVYLVIDRFGGLGSVYRETEVERSLKPTKKAKVR